ncbi:MAG: pseudouridine synthase [Dehalococcoidia bacterium]|jgi:23S rRNA pseudouridine2605 synthase
MKEVTLLKALTDAGAGSRRRVADAIMRGSVRVNGVIISDLRYPVDVNNDQIMVDNHVVDIKPRKYIYLMLNKPASVLSTVRDERGRKTVIDILPVKYRHLGLHPVGRLDKDSTGLLLLTNNGDFTYRLTHPSFECEKEYLVQVDGRLKPEEVRALEKGVELEDGVTHGAVVKSIKSSPPFNYSVTLHEGRKRQVRRMFAALGYRVTALKRVREGSVALGDLGEGCARELSAGEVGKLTSE